MIVGVLFKVLVMVVNILFDSEGFLRFEIFVYFVCDKVNVFMRVGLGISLLVERKSYLLDCVYFLMN